jgi:hypothetical protein
VYTSQVFHKTERYGNVRWNQSPGGLVLLRQQRRSCGVYWSIFAPALIGQRLFSDELVKRRQNQGEYALISKQRIPGETNLPLVLIRERRQGPLYPSSTRVNKKIAVEIERDFSFCL